MASQEEKILCPKCEWLPDGYPYWQCSCGIHWNTFETYGKCPSCGKVWKLTQCPKCQKWSPHAEWYLDLHVIAAEILKEEEIFTSALLK